MNVGEKDRYAGPPRAEKINGAKEAANTLAEKDKLVKKSIEEKEKKKKSTPPAPSLGPESETTSSSNDRLQRHLVALERKPKSILQGLPSQKKNMQAIVLQSTLVTMCTLGLSENFGTIVGTKKAFGASITTTAIKRIWRRMSLLKP